MTGRDRLCAALDFPAWTAAEPFARAVAPEVGILKVGLELFAAEGPSVVRAAAALGRPVFLDLKLHDIPNTVEGAARAAARSGASLLTVHASGGGEMIRAALGARPLLVVPGVRPAGTARGDQARVATPQEAIRAGADVLVLGRPLRDA